MSFKKLFINSEEDAADKPKVEATTSQTKFPSTEATEEKSSSIFNFGFGSTPAPTPAPTFTPSTSVNSEHFAKALEIYENGFDSLNQAGYDFYEFFKAVSQVGADNPQMYTMAFAMGSAMDITITRDKLLQQSEFYLAEINKVYNDYVSKGSAKKNDLMNQKNSENQALVGELEMMNQQMEALRVQIQDRQNKLNAIDSKYGPMISDVDSKLVANETAKGQIVQKIEQVKNGIINNLK
jgi:hypothetical protein